VMPNEVKRFPMHWSTETISEDTCNHRSGRTYASQSTPTKPAPPPPTAPHLLRRATGRAARGTRQPQRCTTAPLRRTRITTARR